MPAKLSFIVISAFVSSGFCLEVMFDLNASDTPAGQMPDEVNVTFMTETKFLTKLHLKRAHHLTLDIPLYTISADSDAHIVRTKVKTNTKKELSFYQDVENRGVFQISNPADETGKKKLKRHLKGEFHVENSKYMFNSDKRSNRKPWKKSLFQNVSTSTSLHEHDDEVYVLELQNTTNFDVFDFRRPATEIQKTPRTTNFEDRLLNLSRPNTSDLPELVKLDRERRAASNDYYIDVAAIIDYKLYYHFYSDASFSPANALQNILEHYAFVYSGIDMLYQGIHNVYYRIHIRLCQLNVLQTRDASGWVDANAVMDLLNADLALSALSQFSSRQGRDLVGRFDHVTLFTGYDLYALNAYRQVSHSVIGIANIGTMCRTDGTSSSVIEDRRGYSTIDTAAHELGHSFSAEHDGLNNTCKFSDRYIMAASNSIETNATQFHPWEFSPCSINYFTSFLRRAMLTSRGDTCLTNALAIESDIPDVSVLLLGQTVQPDDQCKQLYGSASSYCRSLPGVNLSDICHRMYCLNPEDSGYCYQEAALTGTSCGNGKICMYGQCVPNTNAPQIDERCPFGNLEGYVYSYYTCDDLARLVYKDACNDDYYKTNCCGSCTPGYRPLQATTPRPTIPTYQIQTRRSTVTARKPTPRPTVTISPFQFRATGGGCGFQQTFLTRNVGEMCIYIFCIYTLFMF